MERLGNELLPFGVGSAGHTWLHNACWKPWRDRPEREAVVTLASLGLEPIGQPTLKCKGSSPRPNLTQGSEVQI
jgi:hypothetical protein